MFHLKIWLDFHFSDSLACLEISLTWIGKWLASDDAYSTSLLYTNSCLIRASKISGKLLSDLSICICAQLQQRWLVFEVGLWESEMSDNNLKCLPTKTMWLRVKHSTMDSTSACTNVNDDGEQDPFKPDNIAILKTFMRSKYQTRILKVKHIPSCSLKATMGILHR